VTGSWFLRSLFEILKYAFAKAVKDPDFVNVINRMGGSSVVYLDRVQMNKYVDEMFLKFGEIIEALKAKEAKDQNSGPMEKGDSFWNMQQLGQMS